jgi:predicted RNase H-like HicB family nuclease
MLTNPPAYSMRVFWSETDRAFIAVCPELNELSAFGETYEEAVRELRTAIGLAVEVLKEDGKPVPAPSPVVEYSGQFRVRMSRSLHAALVAEAEREGLSLNTLVVSRLAESSGSTAALRRVEEMLSAFRQLSPPTASTALRQPHVRNANFGERPLHGLSSSVEVGAGTPWQR